MTDEFPAGDPLQPLADALRQPVTVAPGLATRARARARQRRTQRVTSAAVLLLSIVAIGLTVHRPASGTPVTFSIVAPTGRSVTVVGDFTDWQSDRVELTPGAAGVWQATVRLRPGRYRYAFLVDHAEWRADNREPSAPDDFGRPTSTVTVVTP